MVYFLLALVVILSSVIIYLLGINALYRIIIKENEKHIKVLNKDVEEIMRNDVIKTLIE